MENRAHALAAGLFLLLLGAVALATVMWFRGDHIERRALIVVTRESIAGLNVKAPVKLRGVEVGKVESIAFDPADARQILIGLQVNASAPLTRGTYAQLGYQGVTGLAFVALADSGNDQRPLAAVAGDASGAPRIDLRPTLLDQIADAGPRLLTGADEATRRVNAVLSDPNRAQLEHALAALGTALDEVNQLLAALKPAAQAAGPLLVHLDQASRDADAVLAASAERLDALRAPLARLDRAVQDFDQLAVDGAALSRELQARSAQIDRLGSAAAQLETTTRHLDRALGASEPAGTAPLLPELVRTSQALTALAHQLGEQPQSLLFGRPPTVPGPGEAGFAAHAQEARP